MKSCENCGPLDPDIERVCIGKHHRKISPYQQFFGVCLIYLPILTLPFVLLSGFISYIHLRLMGAENIKPLTSFFPDRKSFRYTMKNQITMQPGYGLSPTQTKLFWILNCTWYCPVSVGIFEWHAYLVKLVENWWCPFHHSKKKMHYREGALDQSFWHVYPEDIVKLTPEDRDNPIWNENATQTETPQAAVSSASSMETAKAIPPTDT
ncbi:MAG: hypothetical protein ACU837_06725 [Gammaproteobacteria bacterium]